VDKPSASLSADRRGTISIPDLESFIVGAGEVSSGSDRRRRKRKGEESDEEVMPTKIRGAPNHPRPTPMLPPAVTSYPNKKYNVS
jgi:hypothetical protein